MAVINSDQEDSLEVVRLLIEKGADLVAFDDWGFTPLLIAANGCFRGDRLNLKVLNFLLESSAWNFKKRFQFRSSSWNWNGTELVCCANPGNGTELKLFEKQ